MLRQDAVPGGHRELQVHRGEHGAQALQFRAGQAEIQPKRLHLLEGSRLQMAAQAIAVREIRRPEVRRLVQRHLEDHPPRSPIRALRGRHQRRQRRIQHVDHPQQVDLGIPDLPKHETLTSSFVALSACCGLFAVCGCGHHAAVLLTSCTE